jgi:hypothetical protein
MFSLSFEHSGCKIRALDESVTERFLYHELKEFLAILHPKRRALGAWVPTACLLTYPAPRLVHHPACEIGPTERLD